MAGEGTKIFRSGRAIREHYEMGRKAFEKYREQGMPVRSVCGRWHGHADNIDQFFKNLTKAQANAHKNV